MHCPFCQNIDTRVIDSRVSEEGSTIRRRRECPSCGERFSTVETVELKLPASESQLPLIGGAVVPFDKNNKG
jgi:transcriptional repressor NrdR